MNVVNHQPAQSCTVGRTQASPLLLPKSQQPLPLHHQQPITNQHRTVQLILSVDFA